MDRDLATVVETLASVTGQRPGPEDPLTLDSLEQAEATLALEEALGVPLPDDLEFRTPRALTEEVSRRRGRGPTLGDGMGRLQRFVVGVIRRPLRTYYRLRVGGADHVPARGPVVLAANHDSLLDIPLLVIACPRPVWFMAKEELFRTAFGSWLFNVLGGFPVHRGTADVGAVRAALGVLRRGRVLGMYPESTRTPELLPFYPGAAWAALATGAPVVPVGISGTGASMSKGSPLPRRTDVRIGFGEPLEPGREDDPRVRLDRARKLTLDLRAEVERIIEP